MRIKRLFKTIFFTLIISYFLFALFLYFQQRNLIYYPDNQDFYNCPNFIDYEKLNYNGTRFYYKELSENLIVHYHGNAGSACDRSFLKTHLEVNNHSLIFVEYAGYSNDNRNPSKDLILNDVENIVSFIEENNFKNIIVFGESIGSGPAAYQAYISKVNSMILVSPFYDLKSLAQSLYPIFPASIILKENYDNKKWLTNYTGDLLIFHGKKDPTTSYNFSKKLYNQVASLNKEYVLIDKAGHNDIYSFNIFYDKLSKFLKNN